MRKAVVGDATRFLIAGAVNTALTAIVYWVSLSAFSPTVSYSIAWVVGMLFVMVFYPDRVFPGGRRRLRDRLALGAITIVVFLVGLATIATLTEVLGKPIIAFLITVGVTTATNFLLSRALLRRPLISDGAT
jgi:putative flippase GtrA